MQPTDNLTTTQRQSPSHQRIALALFALLTGIYLLTTGAHTSSKDEELLFGVTENLVVWQSFALNAARPHDPPIYSYYGPGQPFTALPLYIVGRSVAGFFPHDAYPWVTRAITLWLNPLVTAATSALTYLAAVFLGYKRYTALATALIYGLATMAWHYSKTFFAEPLTALALFASFTLVLYDHTTTLPRRWYTHPHTLLLVSGVLAGYALTVKVHGALVIPFIVGYAGFGVVFPPDQPLRLHLPTRSELWRIILPRLTVWGAGMLIMLLLLGLYQWYLYGNPFITGYGTGVMSHFNPKYFWYRFSGLLWSPGRGIIWYAPPVLLLPLGLWLLWQRAWQIALLCLGVTLAHLGFYAMLLYWHGGGSWGPRYLVIALPFMILPLSSLLERIRGRQTPLYVIALGVVLLLAIPPQVGSILIANEAFFSTKRNVERDHFDPWDSAIVGHWGLVVDHLTTYYTRLIAPESVAFHTGFSYSEGNRDQGEQVPRWTAASPALISLRPGTHGGHGSTVVVSLGLQGCLPPPLPPMPIVLQSQQTTLVLVEETPCPPRTYHLALPAHTTTLMLQSRLWRPADVGIDRDGLLGVQVRQLAATVVGASDAGVETTHPLTLRGDLIPISPMPTGYVSIRRWTGDHRLAHWDVWLWYVSFSDLPPTPLRWLVGTWLTLALGLIAWGWYTVLVQGSKTLTPLSPRSETALPNEP